MDESKLGPPGDGVSPLTPAERATYRTDPRAGDGSTDAEGVTPGADARPWVGIGVVLLLAFVAILAWAVLEPLL